MRAVARRGGGGSRGCRLDEQGEPLVDYRFSWRRRKKYITDPLDIHWLEEFSRESVRYADMVFLVEAIAGYFRRLSDKLAQEPPPRRPKRKRLKAKERRLVKG